MTTRVKVWYKRNLKVSPAKLAAQVAHAVNGLMLQTTDLDIIVLKASNRQFLQMKDTEGCYIQVDKGLTEIPKGTETCLAYIEN